jgi:sortase A
MRRRFLQAAAVALVILGLWELGHGVWIPLKARLAQVLLHRAWSRTMAGERHAKPWPWADTWPAARLRAPRYDVDLYVLAGANPRTLAFGPALVGETTLEEDGGMTVIAAHRDTHFRFVQALRAGDEITLDVPGQPRRRYTVIGAEILDTRAARLIGDADDSRLVLATCYPFETLTPGGPERYLVFAGRTR